MIYFPIPQARVYITFAQVLDKRLTEVIKNKTQVRLICVHVGRARYRASDFNSSEISDTSEHY